MKRTVLFFAICLGAIISSIAQPTFSKYDYTLDYFLPNSFPDIKNGGEVKLTGKFNPAIPQPKEILGFELGEFYPEWLAILHYMYTLDRLSDRVKIRTVGLTYEKRPIIEVTISSPENIKRIDEIRAEHLKLSDATVSKDLDISKMPSVVSIVNAVHGNEHSSASASLAMAYFYTASEDPTILDILDKSIILITPSINPDGMNRFSAWCNAESSTGQHIADVNTREYSLNEPYPLSRANHYWHDANRDHILTQHPEGKAFAKMACEWIPNLTYDNHESSQTRGLFRSPGILEQTHPLLPMEGQEKSRLFGEYTTAILSGLQNTYSDARYDSYYIGQGWAYPCAQGAIGILVEQTNSRGFLRPLENGGVLPLSKSVRNHSYVSIVSVFAAYQNREMLHNYQRDFFIRTAEQAKQAKTKGYIFNTRGDRGMEYAVLEWMKNQHFDIYKLAKDTKVNGVTYSANESYIVPAEQRFYLKFKIAWEEITKFPSKNFYDVSSWSLKYAFNVQESEVESVDGLIGEKVNDFSFPEGKVSKSSDHGYLIEAKELYYHNMLRAMLLKGVRVDIATQPFKVGKEMYGYGTAYIPVEGQPLSATEIYNELEAAAKMNGVDVEGLNKPLTLNNYKTLSRQPRVAFITGEGFKDYDSGEIWHLLDRRFGITPTRIDINRLHLIEDYNAYDVFIVPNGEPLFPVSDKMYSRLNEFVKSGGTIIAFINGNKVLKDADLNHIALQPVPADLPKPKQIAGMIVSTEIDHTDPLGYGYEEGIHLPILKRGNVFIDAGNSSFDKSVVKGSATPYLSGYILQSDLDKITSNPLVVKSKVGKGTIIYSAENLAFRSYWYGSMKLFMNSIYFGNF